MAGFPVILNYFRHNGVFATGKTPNYRAQRHCDKCFTQNGRANWHQSGKQKSDVLLGSDLDLNSLQSTSRHSDFLLVSTHPNITEKLLTRFNSLPHIFPHCEITSMQRVFHFVLAWPRL